MLRAVHCFAALKTKTKTTQQTPFLCWKAEIDQMEKKCQELIWTFLDEYVAEVIPAK